MADVFKFPNNGYDVKVLRKEDVLASIDRNIVDKEVALAIVKRCEIDAANFLREGRWAGIPFIGNIRIPQTVKMLTSDESKAILEEAKDTLDETRYLLFRKNYANDIGKQVKMERYYRYVVSKFVGKASKFFRRMADRDGELHARIVCYTLCDVILDNASYE